MSKILTKIKENYKKVILLVGLFLAVFLLLFWLVNLDLKSIRERYFFPQDASQNVSGDAFQSVLANVNLGDELKKKIGSTELFLESYAEWTKRFDLYQRNIGLDTDVDGDGLPNYLEYLYGTNPLKADSDGDGFSDKQEIINGYDPDAQGDARPAVEINVSKIGVTAPMIWSKSEDEKEMLLDLEKGVSHFAKTASPGQNGNAIISGHSSNYIWAKGNYNYVFKDLNNLEKGDEFVVKSAQKNGRVIVYHYKVVDKFIAAPDDEKIFSGSDMPILTLSTCWPLGTNFKRLIVRAEMVK